MTDQEFTFEYRFTPSPDADERLQQAIDLILDLIQEDIRKEIESSNGGEPC